MATRSALFSLLLLPGCHAYAHLSAQYGVPWKFSWSMPLSETDEGLGGGITYMIQEGLCERILSRFREQSQHDLAAVLNLGVVFVDCNEIIAQLCIRRRICRCRVACGRRRRRSSSFISSA